MLHEDQPAWMSLSCKQSKIHAALGSGPLPTLPAGWGVPWGTIPGVWPLQSCRELEGKFGAQKGKSRWDGGEELHQQLVLLLTWFFSLFFAGPTGGAGQGGPRWAAGMSSVRATAVTPGDTHMSSDPPGQSTQVCQHIPRW